ncbi:MAG: hypothetical protein WD557_08370 [Dehalococcoidia bacterium]
MKLLLLGNSMDRQRDVPSEQRRGSLMARELEAATGEPVEIVTKGFWPSARVAGLVGQWLEEEQPDLLLITATAYPFAYPSVPLRVARLLGPLGKPVRRAGVGAANTPWLAHNAIFRALRRFAQVTIGGATYLTVDEVIANISDAVRVAVRHEDVVVVLKGPGGGGRYQPTARASRAAEAKRQRVLDALEKLCAEVHVDFIRHDIPDYVRNPEVPLIGDGIHGLTEYHEVAAGELTPALIAAWQRHHTPTPNRLPAIGTEPRA